MVGIVIMEQKTDVTTFQYFRCYCFDTARVTSIIMLNEEKSCMNS